MTISDTAQSGISEPQPLFLSQFLRLPLRKLDAVTDALDADATLFTSAPVADTIKSIALPDSISPWKDFKKQAMESLRDIPDAEGYQHILPPPAFRKGDLPQATMSPTVHLWCIMQAWQPFNRVLQLDEELAYGDGRGPLQLGDHLARHNNFSGVGTLPRQVVYRSSEKGIRAPVLVRAPWTLSIPDLFASDGVSPLARAELPDEASSVLQELHGYMVHAKSKYALLTTYNHFVFLRMSADSALELSPPIASESTDVTVYTALWVWARAVAAEE